MLERKHARVKRASKSGVGAKRAKRAEREKGVKMEENGIQIAMIRNLAMRSNVDRVGNLRQHVHYFDFK